jgi:hypothetical protein
MCIDWGVSIRRACGALRFDASTSHSSFRRTCQVGVRQWVRKIEKTGLRYGHGRACAAQPDGPGDQLANDVLQTLECVCVTVGCPKLIRVDAVSAFVSRDHGLWADAGAVTLGVFRPGKPVDNGFKVGQHRTCVRAEKSCLSSPLDGCRRIAAMHLDPFAGDTRRKLA